MKEIVNKISENITITAMAAKNGEKVKTATIDIEGIIGYSWEESPNTAKLMRKELKAISKLNAEEIIVNIHSLGGSVDHGLAIHDLLRENKARIITNVYGMSASAATIIAQAGDVRRVSINSLYLVHHAWNFFIANAIELEGHLDDMKKIDSRLADIYARRSGKSKEEILKLMDQQNGNGSWLEPDEVLEHELTDEVFEPEPKQAAAAAACNRDFMAFSQKMHLPELPKNWKNKLKKEENIENNTDEHESTRMNTDNGKNTKPANNNSQLTTHNPITKENKMEPNFKDFREAFGAECALSYLEAGLSLEQAQAAHAHVVPLNEKITSLESDVKTQTKRADDAEALVAEYKNEYPLKPDNSVPPNLNKKGEGEDNDDPDPVADFEAKVTALVTAGKADDSDAKAAARSRAAAENPELYEQYLASFQK